MRFIFKTRYDQDLQLFKDRTSAGWYAALLLALVVAPFVVPDYYRTQMVFVFIYGIVGLGLMLLSGFTGQFSMGHAAFLAIGAYAEMYLQKHGWPFVFSAPAGMVLAGLAGILDRLASAPAFRNLSGDCNHFVWLYRRRSTGSLGIGDWRQRGRFGSVTQAGVRKTRRRNPVLFSLSSADCRSYLAVRELAALADRARVHRDS